MLAQGALHFLTSALFCLVFSTIVASSLGLACGSFGKNSGFLDLIRYWFYFLKLPTSHVLVTAHAFGMCVLVIKWKITQLKMIVSTPGVGHALDQAVFRLGHFLRTALFFLL